MGKKEKIIGFYILANVITAIVIIIIISSAYSSVPAEKRYNERYEREYDRFYDNYMGIWDYGQRYNSSDLRMNYYKEHGFLGETLEDYQEFIEPKIQASIVNEIGRKYDLIRWDGNLYVGLSTIFVTVIFILFNLAIITILAMSKSIMLWLSKKLALLKEFNQYRKSKIPSKSKIVCQECESINEPNAIFCEGCGCKRFEMLGHTYLKYPGCEPKDSK